MLLTTVMCSVEPQIAVRDATLSEEPAQSSMKKKHLRSLNTGSSSTATATAAGATTGLSSSAAAAAKKKPAYKQGTSMPSLVDTVKMAPGVTLRTTATQKTGGPRTSAVDSSSGSLSSSSASGAVDPKSLTRTQYMQMLDSLTLGAAVTFQSSSANAAPAAATAPIGIPLVC